MRETNKFLRRKLANKKKVNPYDERGGGKRKNISKPSKYRKQEIEDSIDEYYRNAQ